MLKKYLLGLAIASMVCTSTTQAASFAAQVVSYDPGQGFNAKYTNSTVVLGEPSQFNPWGDDVNPFNPPYETNQILSLGTNGSLIVKFNTPIVNDPANPYGIDFIVFGHSCFSANDYGVPPSEWTAATPFGTNSGISSVSVSCDGVQFFRLDPSKVPSFDRSFPTDGQGNFHVPVDPAVSLTDFAGATLDKFRALYKGSGGGAGYDISWAQDASGNSVYLPTVSYIRIDELAGTAMVDAISDVFSGTIITEDFSSDPTQRGWKIFGNTNLYHWNSTSQSLDVTWDSSETTNSYFYHPLNTIANRNSSFGMSFDLTLYDYAAGTTVGKPFTFEIAMGFQNHTNAIAPNFHRALMQSNPNLVEFTFFPSVAGTKSTVWPSMVSTNGVLNDNGSDNDQTFTALPLNIPMHVTMTYDPGKQTLLTTLTTNGIPVAQIKEVGLSSAFTDYRINQFSIPNYSDALQAGSPGGSLRAHGQVRNITITAPPPPVQNFAGQFTGGQWTASFVGQTNWTYTLEGTADLQNWTSVSTTIKGGGKMTLPDTSSTSAPYQFYRVRSDWAN